jgi:tetratricopeptide (TPR) repeat protein
MVRRLRIALLCVCAAASSALVSATAYAEDAPAKEKKDADKDKPKAAKKSAFNESVEKGHKLVIARDFPGAVAAYREAIGAEAQNAYGHYYLGEAQLLKGDLAEAEASWQAALRFAKDEELKAKLLLVAADLKERQGKLDEAKGSWTDYGKFVAEHPKSKGHPAVPGERQKVIDTHNDLAKKYGEVKARIKARLDEVGKPPPDDGPQGPGKGGAAPKK